MARNEGAFAERVVQWQLQHGRHQLPWQIDRNPYRVWLSEIMLQQTQVATVIGYYARFLERFPNVHSLAEASVDEVLGLWSGLGYYSRARNLHRCAQQLVAEFGGQFPSEAATLQTLPGIGRSTAAAITSMCSGERVAILDANVKRVLTRHLGYAEDLSISRHEQGLWELATAALPQSAAQMPAYTQGMMDLGATVCLHKKPLCELCPVRATCVAHAQDAPQNYPVRTRKLKRSSLSIWMLWAQTLSGDVWLARRPTNGVWGGLQCFPLFEGFEDLVKAVPTLHQGSVSELPVVTHVLTHRDLYLHPCVLKLDSSIGLDTALWGEGRWVPSNAWQALGLPAPVRKLLQATALQPNT